MNDVALLARDVGVSERTLRRAVHQGTLRASRPIAKRLDLPLSERIYVRRSWPLLSALRAALRTEHNVRFALLFGSAAAGTDTAESDVDVVVELRDPSLERLVDLSTKLTGLIGRPVDVVRLQALATDSAALADVLAEGRVLVDREGVWSRLSRQVPRLQRRGRDEDARLTEAALAGIDRLLVDEDVGARATDG